MSPIPAWQEVESKVYRPGRWLIFLVGTIFVVAGVGLIAIGCTFPPVVPPWFGTAFAGVFVLLGGVVLAFAISSICLPIHVRHAAPDVLPNVPKEPVICEGSVVHGRLTHELCENAQGWEFRPAGHVWRNDKRFLLGFGIPFLTVFSGLLTWVFHSQLNIANWPVSAVCGIFVTAVCGGTVFVLIGMIMRSGYRRLSQLTIPRNGNDLELESDEALNVEKMDLAEGLKWLFGGGTKKQHLTIPRELVVAVQLCPWKFVVQGPEPLTTWAVQGLLVLESSEKSVYHRLPIMLTGDFVGAAQLMQRLAHTLQVPYLFCADAAGWKTEEIQAKKRPPLQSGGTQT